MRICRRDFGLGLLSGGCAAALGAPARPKLLVLVLLEQLRAEAVESLEPQFGPGGFRRLFENGARFPDCRHLASSFSSSAITTLATGAWPSQHGIVADSWYEHGSKRVVRASDLALRATTLGAQVAAEPRTRVFVVGLDRAQAALFAGTLNVQLYWMDEGGQFTTGAPPDWLTQYNRRTPIENFHNAEWRALGARPAAPPLRVLKFDPAKPAEFLSLYKASPLGEEAQFEFLAELIAREKVGQGETQDFVCLLAGSSALLGYETGGRSPLMQQLLLRLDQHLEFLMNTLTKTCGDSGYNLVFTAAHGAPPAPPQVSRERMAVNGEALAEAVDKALTASGSGKVEKYVYPFLYLDAAGFRDPEPIRLAAARAALLHPAVSGYYTAGGACSSQDEWARRFRNSFHLARSGDVMLSYLPEYIEDYGGDRGVSYGSLYNYDTRVPLIFYGPQFGTGVFDSPVESVDVAPTLARAMGVAEPSSSVGRVLSQALRQSDE